MDSMDLGAPYFGGSGVGGARCFLLENLRVELFFTSKAIPNTPIVVLVRVNLHHIFNS